MDTEKHERLPTLDDLRQRLRETRAYMLEQVVGVPEVLLQQPGAVGPYSVAQMMAIRIEAANRTLTLAQSMYHGLPYLYPLPREAYVSHSFIFSTANDGNARKSVTN